MLPKLRHPLPVFAAVLFDLRDGLLQGFHLLFALGAAPCVVLLEPRVFVPVDNAVCKAFIQGHEQLLEPLMLRAFLVELPLHLLGFCGSQGGGIRHGKNIVQINHVPDILLYRVQNQLFQRFVPHPMGRAALVLLVRRADVVDVFLLPGGDGLAHHACAALAAEHHPAEKLHRAVAGAAAGIQRAFFDLPLHFTVSLIYCSPQTGF